MAVDPNILLQARGVTLPDPMEMQGRAMSLAKLMTEVQSGQLGLDEQRAVMAAMQNPDVMQAIFKGGGMPSLSPEQMHEYGPGMGKLGGMALGFQKIGSEINKNDADTLKMRRDTLDATLKSIANQAVQFAQNPTSDKMQNIAFQLGRVNADVPGMPPPGSPPQAIQKWLLDVSSFATDPGTLATITEKMTKLPGEVAHTAAQTGQSLEETRLAPVKVGIESFKATTERFKPDQVKNELTGVPEYVSGWQTAFGRGGVGGAPGPGQNNSGANGPAGAVAPSVRPPAQAPAGGAAMGGEGKAVGSGVNAPMTPSIDGEARPVMSGGKPLQVSPTPGQKELITSGGKEIDDLTARSTAAADMKAMVVDLRNLEANQGLMSGGVAGTEFFRKAANVLAPFLTPEQQKVLASTQAWDAESKALVAQAVRQFAGSRVAARELPFFESTKPNELQRPAGRELVYKMLYNVADRIQQAKVQADQQMKTGNVGLAGWVPTFKEVRMPPITMTAPDGYTHDVNTPDEAARVRAQWATMGGGQ